MTGAGGIDVDRPSTWPPEVASAVHEHAERLRGTAEYAGDLDVSYDDEGEFLTLLAGRPLRMYHCTRLLDEEVELVRRHGLRMLTRELMAEKIRLAVDVGAVTAAEREGLARAHVFATGEQGGREERVCLLLSAGPLDDDPHGVRPLMRTWGGEALSMSSRAGDWRTRLQDLGQPTVVVVETPIDPAVRHSIYPGVLKTFVGAALGLDTGADVHYRAHVPADAVVGIWRPGHASYDALRALPPR